MTIVLRNTKSIPLTFEELDGNFTDLNARLTTIESTNVTAVNGLSGNITIVTDNINEGSTNLYYTTARFDGRLATKTTDNLAQGTTNLYYADSLVDARLNLKSIGSLLDVDTTSVAPNTSEVLTWDGTRWKPAVAPGAAGGEANTGSNIGTGRALYKQKIGTALEFYSIRSIDQYIDVDSNTGNDTIDVSFNPTADVSFNNFKITDVVDPANAQDAATKAYVDAQISSFSSNIDLAGDTGTDTYTTGNTLTFAGTANEIETTVTNDTVTIGLPDNVTIANNFTLTGASTSAVWANASNRFEFGDNAKVSLGSAQDFEIYHNGTHSFIQHTGNGNLRIQGNDLVLETQTSANYLKGYNGGAVEIYYNGNKKVETTNTGIQTTGDINVNGAYTLPTADGTSGQVLQTDGLGNLTFATTSVTLSDLGITTATATELDYSAGVTSSIQTQLNTLTSNKLALSGGTMTGAIAMGTNKITGAGDPTLAQDVATKNYVDAQISGLSSTLTISDGSVTDDVTVGTNNLVFASGTNISTAVTDNTVTINVTGTVANATDAVNADKINIQSTTTAANHYVTFVDATSGDEDIYVNANLLYNPNTDVLQAGTFSGTATQAQYADLAEIYKPDTELKPGTVVVVGGNEEVRKYQPGDEYIAGVVSTDPAYLMNSSADGQPIALVGRVPVICTGPCTKGQPLLAIADGKVSMNGSGPIVGIALETRSENEDKLVEVMLKI